MIPVSIGRGGITKRPKECDPTTPAGEHEIIGMLYRPDRMQKPRDWAMPILLNSFWSDDVKDPDYNLMVPFTNKYSRKKLRISGPSYDLIILTDWNWPAAIKGRGSAFFIHQWKNTKNPTEGSIGMSRQDLRWLASKITYGTKIVV
jgi:L,D-peptidoglycan transpeptidase YkuD (ErfK/YbiS/YcfS/YnhG family)